MHGRKREEYKALQRDTKVAAGLAKKAQAWHQLNSELLQRRETKDCSDVTLQLNEKALTVNPDPLWLWNHRREILVAKTERNAKNSVEILEGEQKLTQASLQNNPKAYGGWHHRKWSIVYLLLSQNSRLSSSKAKEILLGELELTALFLTRDERNFHCWSYRRFVVSCLLHCSNENPSLANGSWNIDDTIWMGAQVLPNDTSSENTSMISLSKLDASILQTEWDFTETKIHDNFSNFSAFHYRSKLLPLMIRIYKGEMNQQFSSLETLVTSEFELVSNAVFTEPDDQTAWWYQRFLFDFMRQQEQNDNWYTALLQSHVEQLQELQEEMATSKWVLSGLLQTLEQLPDTESKRRDILNQLITLDSDRKERYLFLLKELEK